jgi:hypothetical protein
LRCSGRLRVKRPRPDRQKDTYMITKQSAGGLAVSGSSVKADILIEANAFCAKSGKSLELLNSNSKNAIPFARMPSAEISFKCVASN